MAKEIVGAAIFKYPGSRSKRQIINQNIQKDIFAQLTQLLSISIFLISLKSE